MKKIIIIGMTGVGKTTLANKINKITSIPIFYLDIIFWKDDGHIKDVDFTHQQEEIMINNECWIMDGGFPRSRSFDLRISHADTIIFFDIPLYLIFWRQFKRYLKYHNKIRPDMGKKQIFPFSIRDIKYALNFPISDIYKKIEENKDGKEIVIINNNKDQADFLQKLKSLQD